MEWTERCQASAQIIATTRNTPTKPLSGVLRQRPLCPYPQAVKCNSRLDINKASSWYSADPVLALPPLVGSLNGHTGTHTGRSDDDVHEGCEPRPPR
ncbi:hypothetical protein SPBR_09181 [Sporothrix brasiliensis 5110]|uniref:Uncharacterized protein n=1 Tax=Sporothrix brasiliensis 5110 TaxID=1398154 RepID=A0A0C2J9B5_9PEZI|nr:uncharacterized protein SPBR_09181 [Sporothrix brasiliensis 5110]KIH93557.1 hypothetical protein SPBR_09181 [Sporothrix brasiliensis 5110]